MKPNTATLIAAMRSGLSTQAELAEHHGVPIAEILKPMQNIVYRGLATRSLEGSQVEYRLTEKGKNWTPEQRTQAWRDSMRRGRAVA